MKTIEELQRENDNLRQINKILESRFNNMQIWKNHLQDKLDKNAEELYKCEKSLTEVIDVVINF